jgi:ribose-phosphate pyrophosphokinase
MIEVFVDYDKVSLETWTFPAGDQGVRISSYEEDTAPTNIWVEARIASSDDIMQLLMVTDALRRKYFDTGNMYLSIPYVPYAQQDRVCNPGEALSIKVMADLINNLEYDRVFIRDPHSEVTSALIHNVEVVNLFSDECTLPGELFDYLEGGVLVSPDAGAVKRTETIARWFDAKVLYGRKKRDLSTGAITSISIPSLDFSVAGKVVVIVDDICMGGGTFIPHAKQLKEAGAAKVVLLVTHGIFNNGLEQFNGIIDEIFCSDSYNAEADTTEYDGNFVMFSVS